MFGPLVSFLYHLMLLLCILDKIYKIQFFARKIVTSLALNYPIENHFWTLLFFLFFNWFSKNLWLILGQCLHLILIRKYLHEVDS